MMHRHDDDFAHRNPTIEERPLDAAGQSLADALRASFKILKGIMMVLVVLYLFSNVRCVQSHEQALILRLGRLLPGVKDPGLVWAFPYPLDEIIPLPTNKINETLIDSHTFHRREFEIGQPLNMISRDERRGLHPALDGALLTAESGLIHVRWNVSYRIKKVQDFVSNFFGDKTETADALIRVLVETFGIRVASEMTAEEFIRTRTDHVKSEMKRRINKRLDELNAGITVTMVEMIEQTPPLQIKGAFERTQRNENFKKKRIDEAKTEATQILSHAAGGIYPELLDLIDEIDKANSANQPTVELRKKLDRMLSDRVEGEANRVISEASAYHAVVVGRMQSDVELYRALLPEYERNPDGLIARLWERTQQYIFENPGVRKLYKPEGTKIRIQIPLDPDAERIDEEQRLQDRDFDVRNLLPRKRVIVPDSFGH
ncbi:MAG: hypothetical protein IH987_12700 [Planctomycetes bacterium]|nr:hypothetical protein [Planctomycetota bacterium]